MLSCSRRRFFQILNTPQGPENPQKLCFLEQSRGIRTKGGTGYYSDALRRDERLLKRLEAQLANVQAKVKREEEESLELMKKQTHHGTTKTAQGNQALESHNFHFWEKVLTPTDRQNLASHGMHSLDELFTVSRAAEAAMSSPPYPKPESLPPRLRLAHEMYQSIPTRVAEAARAKAKAARGFGGWF